jgi:hypothetical protein
MTMAAFLEFKKHDMSLYTIVGNHDIARNQMEKLKKSPLQILFTAEVLEQINLQKRVVINKKTLITPVSYMEYPTPKYNKAPYNILLAHMFFNASELFTGNTPDGKQDNRHNIQTRDLTNWEYNAAVLGHDHVEYPTMRVGNTDLIRPGAVTRATSHEYNFYRTPCFYILHDPSRYDSSNWERVDVKSLPFDEVASTSVSTKKSLDNMEGLKSLLSDLASRLVRHDSGDNEDTVVAFIKQDDKISDEVRQLLFHYFEECGITI